MMTQPSDLITRAQALLKGITPGEWSYFQGSSSVHSVDRGDKLPTAVCVVTGPRSWQGKSARDLERHANGLFIAASKKLIVDLLADQGRLIGILSGLQPLIQRWRGTANTARELGEKAEASTIDELLDEISAAVSGLHQETWYPIASAPKDGTRILAAEWIDGKYLTPPQAEPIQSVAIVWWWKGDKLNPPRFSGGFMEQPTHWRPLPDPPSVEGSVLIEHKEEEPQAAVSGKLTTRD